MNSSNVFVLVTAVVGALATSLAKIYPAEATLITGAGSLICLVLSQLSHQSGHAMGFLKGSKS